MRVPVGVPQVGRQNLCLSVGLRLNGRAFSRRFYYHDDKQTPEQMVQEGSRNNQYATQF